jgi:hypothetical protein
MGKVITFETLWKNYPGDPPCRDPKTGRIPPGYENQCAMRVGYALEKSGVSFQSFRGGRCPGAPRGSGLVANAEELANWLRTRPFPECPAAVEYTGKEAFAKIEKRTGIIFVADYWQRPTDRGSARTGDHIDLWNGSRMTAFSSWFRVHLHLSWDGVWSNFRLAPKVLFWHVW